MRKKPLIDRLKTAMLIQVIFLNLHILTRCFRDEILASFMSARFNASRFRCQDELESKIYAITCTASLASSLFCFWRGISWAHLLTSSFSLLQAIFFLIFYIFFSFCFAEILNERKILKETFKMIEIGAKKSRSSFQTYY